MLQIGEKRILRSDMNKNADVGVNAVCKHQVKKQQKQHIWEENFAPIILKWRKILLSFCMAVKSFVWV